MFFLCPETFGPLFNERISALVDIDSHRDLNFDEVAVWKTEEGTTYIDGTFHQTSLSLLFY